MENILSLDEEMDLFMKMKLSICKCNPCNCSERKKELYFQELEDILTKFNRDYMRHLLEENRTFVKIPQGNSSIHC